MKWNKVASQTINLLKHQRVAAICLKQWHTKASLHRMSLAAMSLVAQVTHEHIQLREARTDTKIFGHKAFSFLLQREGRDCSRGAFWVMILIEMTNTEKQKGAGGSLLTYCHWDTTKFCNQHFANVHILGQCQEALKMVSNWQHGFAKNRLCQTSLISFNDSVNRFVIKG